MASTDRRDLFDAWARSYDETIESSDAYPFAGYEEILERIASTCRPISGLRILDVGIGTGNLAQRLTAPDAEVWGLDFSDEMLEQCRAKLPGAHLIQADLRQGLPAELPDAFDRIVSAYVLHEFPDNDKLRLLRELAGRLPPGGTLVIGDIAFADAAAMATCRQAWKHAWDENEHYWVAEQMVPALESLGLDVRFEPLSFCGGLFTLQGAAR